MRTPILAAVLGLSLVGCLTVGDSGPGTGDDGTDPGPGPGPGPGPTATPKVDVTIDKTAIPTELKTSNLIMVTVKGSGGFSGNVALSAAIVDANDAPLAGWTVDFSSPSVTLAADGTGTAVATLKIPAKNAGLAGSVKIIGTSTATAGTNTAVASVTALNQVTFAVKVDAATGKCVYPADAGTTGAPVALALGTKVRFFNTGTANLEIHSGGVISHQGQNPNGTADPVTEANTAYEQQPTGAGAATWYCHAPATDLGANDPRFTVQ